MIEVALTVPKRIHNSVRQQDICIHFVFTQAQQNYHKVKKTEWSLSGID